MHHHEKLTLTETIGSVLWFVMDGCWMLQQGTMARAMIVPTLAVNLWVFRYTKASFTEISVMAAMNAWLVMNICWMVGDLAGDPAPLVYARAMFVLGGVLLIAAFARNAMNPGGLAKVLAHFRRLRI